MKTLPLCFATHVVVLVLMSTIFEPAAQLQAATAAAPPAGAGKSPTTNNPAVIPGRPLATAAGSIPRPIPVRFRPLTTNAPVVRVTGGSRGTGDQTVQLDVLAPNDVGLTTSEQPDLFYYQSRPSQARFELTLLRRNHSKPLLRIQKNEAAASGIQRVSLSQHGVKLEKGVEYQWVVALITDPANRSTDLVASGMIQRIDLPTPLQHQLTQAQGLNIAQAYAESGIWYDTLSSLSQWMDKNPGDTSLKNARASLLEQIGLSSAAVHDSR